MTLTISIPKDVAAKLRERAGASGRRPAEYASDLVTQAMKTPSLEELLAPVQDEFAKSDMTEKQLLDLGRKLLRKVRHGKKF